MTIAHWIARAKPRPFRLATGATVAAAAALVLTGCVPGSAQPATEVDQKEGPAELLVWTDSTREAAFKMYAEEHPEVDLTIEILPDDVEQRLLLANQAGEGWPDIITLNKFQIDAFSSEPVNYSANIAPYLSDGFFDDFAPAVVESCSPEADDVRCVPNDISPIVLWYNAPFLAENGYDIPETWEEFEALGLQIAQEHPGYIVSDGAVRLSMFPPSRCPQAEKVDELTILSDLADPKCERVISMVDNLLAAGAMTPLAGNSPEFIAEFGEPKKLAMLVGPAHVGKFRLLDAYGWQPGDLGVAPPLRWADEDEVFNYSSGVSYAVSRHSEYLQAATDVVEWLATGPYQTAEETVTLPAYKPAQDNWITTNEASFVIEDGSLADVFEAAQDSLSNYWFEMPVESVRASWDQVVMPGIAQGKTVAELVPTWQQYIIDEGEAAGWTVETER